MSGKGVAFSVITIIILLGVLGVTIWSGYQLSIGSRYGGSYSDVSKQDASSFKIEDVKRLLEQDLRFSSHQSSLKIAANGGTDVTTFWYCAGTSRDLIPSPKEVKYSLTNTALDYFNIYINTSKKEGELFEFKGNISEYKCVGIFEPSEDLCSSSSSKDCENFISTATGGSEIEVYQPSYMNESDEIISYQNNNRFFWLYQRLYDDYFDYSVGRAIQDAFNICGGGISKGESQVMIDDVLKSVCEHYKNSVFDEYVDCSYEILCFAEMNEGTCLSSACMRPDFVQDLCEAPQPKIQMKGFDDLGSKKIFFQDEGTEERHEYRGKGSLRFRITLTDNKYTIPSIMKEPKKLVWNINGAIQIDYGNCPIVWYTKTGGGGTVTDGGPGPLPT